VRFAFAAVLVAAVSCTSTGPAAPSAAASASAETAASPTQSAPTPTPKPTPVVAWTYEGTVRENAIDARNVALPDGGYRQVFSRFRSFKPGPEGQGVDAYYITAISKDGLHWTDEGESSLGYFIPVRLPDGTYRAFALAAPGGVYRSTDAKAWTLVGRIISPEIGNPQCGSTSGMFSDVIALPDDTLRGYYNCVVGNYFNIPATEVKSATSKDGLVWQKDPGVRIDPLDGQEVPRGADGQVNGPGGAEHPRVVTLADGTLKMFYHSVSLLWSATSIDGLTWTNRHFEGVSGADADVIVLPDDRLRVFVNGGLGLPREFAGKSPGENMNRMVSYVYGPTNFRLGVSMLGSDCAPCPIGLPAHFAVAIEGSGPRVTLGAVRYEHAAALDLVNGSDSSVKVAFTPPSGSPPFTADATITFAVRGADQGPILAAGILIVADDSITTVVVPLGWSRGGGGPPGPIPPCQLGADVPVGGCYVPGSQGPDGGPLHCAPLTALEVAAQPPVCRPYLVPAR
jgi:hypothetical protein